MKEPPQSPPNNEAQGLFRLESDRYSVSAPGIFIGTEKLLFDAAACENLPDLNKLKQMLTSKAAGISSGESAGPSLNNP